MGSFAIFATLSHFSRIVSWKHLAIAFVVVGVLTALVTLREYFGPTPAQVHARQRWYICAETGKSFRVELSKGMRVPVHSPHSGRDTGVPAELCYWNSDGSIRAEPTAVLLNEQRGGASPTFCPDCDRLVVPFNPPPIAGAAPPTSRELRRTARR